MDVEFNIDLVDSRAVGDIIPVYAAVGAKEPRDYNSRRQVTATSGLFFKTFCVVPEGRTPEVGSFFLGCEGVAITT